MDHMPYFSDKENGPAPRIVEEISRRVWGGIIATIQSRINDASFGSRFPETCQDVKVPCGCDEKSFVAALKAEISDLSWPLSKQELPPTLAVLDLLEFCYKSVGKPEIISYHDFFKHNHLRFKRKEGQASFRDDINLILARNGLAYELNTDGVVERIPSEALEKLWDAWERLKTIEPGNKKESVNTLLTKCATEPQFREVLENEAKELTWIGNNLGIRHSETTQESLERGEHVDYLFHRLFALINMIILTRDARSKSDLTPS